MKLNHLLVPSKDKIASANFFAEMMGNNLRHQALGDRARITRDLSKERLLLGREMHFHCLQGNEKISLVASGLPERGWSSMQKTSDLNRPRPLTIGHCLNTAAPGAAGCRSRRCWPAQR